MRAFIIAGRILSASIAITLAIFVVLLYVACVSKAWEQIAYGTVKHKWRVRLFAGSSVVVAAAAVIFMVWCWLV